MKFYDKLPDAVEYEGKTYRLNLNFRRVLFAADAAQDSTLSTADRLKYALDALVIGARPDDWGLLKAIFSLLAPERTGKPGEKAIDLAKDWAFIYSGFRQTYGINLFKDDLHYLEFVALLNGLPDNTRMAQIIDIRTREIPERNKYNAKEIARLIELKAEYSLKEPVDFQKGLNTLFERLKAQAERGDRSV